MLVLSSHFVLRNSFIYHLNRTHVTSKMASSTYIEVDMSKYGRVMAIYPITCKEMATRRKKLYL